jgi:hypothetical protein
VALTLTGFAVALAQSAVALAVALTPSATQTTGQSGAGTSGQGGTSPAKAIATATLEQCATATSPQTERSATFAGEMNAVAGTARMEMRIALEERGPEEVGYHTVPATDLTPWQRSSPGVKVFTHIQQFTNLSAPAFYRGVIHFRWLNAHGHVIKSSELRTVHCEQPLAPTSTTTTGAAGSAAAGASASQAGGAS